MRFIPRKYRKYLVFASVAIGFSLLIHQIGKDINRIATASYSSASPMPQVEMISSHKSVDEPGRKCLPERASNAQFIGQHQGTHSLYTIWNFNAPDGELVLYISRLFGGEVCGFDFDSRYNESFSDYLSEDLSRQLYLVFHRSRIEQVGGLESYQVYFDEGKQQYLQTGELSYLPPESFWALNELGIDLHEEAYQTFSEDDPIVPQGPPTREYR